MVMTYTDSCDEYSIAMSNGLLQQRSMEFRIAPHSIKAMITCGLLFCAAKCNAVSDGPFSVLKLTSKS